MVSVMFGRRNDMNYFYIGLAILAILIVAETVFYYRRKEKRLLKNLNKMLDSAVNGDFTETIFDESMLSSVETRLNQYLSLCTVSSKNLSAEKEKIKELISDISHQTKIPIANILLYTDLLREQKMPIESGECVTALSQQAEKLNFLIGSLIKTSRLETGIVTLNPKQSEINEMLFSVKAQILPKTKAKNTEISLADTDEKAIFDEKWTTEAIYNIVDNAVKYTKENGRIDISVTPYQLFCKIDIKDNGIGISESEQPKIFSRFYRSEAVNQTEGVGIGLYLAREIISGQGGYIKIQSEVGKGSVFSVFLPVDTANLSKL